MSLKRQHLTRIKPQVAVPVILLLRAIETCEGPREHCTALSALALPLVAEMAKRSLWLSDSESDDSHECMQSVRPAKESRLAGESEMSGAEADGDELCEGIDDGCSVSHASKDSSGEFARPPQRHMDRPGTWADDMKSVLGADTLQQEKEIVVITGCSGTGSPVLGLQACRPDSFE